MRTNVLPIHWDWVRTFLRLFSEARAIHVQGQIEAALTHRGFDYALEPYLQQKVHSMEVRKGL